MSLVYVGIFLFGIFMSLSAAVYVPKKKNEWRTDDAPKVVTKLKQGAKDDLL